MTETVQHGVTLTGDRVRLREFRSTISMTLTPFSVMTR
jgi:hypothetical protein